VVCSGIAAIMGIVNGADLTGIVLDMSISLSVICAIELCYESEKAINKYLSFVAITAIGTFAVLYLSNPITLDQVLSRGAIWTGIYYCTSMFWAAPFMLARAYFKKKRKSMILPLVYYIFAGVISILFLKRQFIVEGFALILVLAVFSMIKMKSLRKSIKVVIITGVLLLIGYFVIDKVLKLGVSDIIERILFRFEQTEETGFVRFTEMKNYFSNTNLLSLFIGKGFGVAHYGLGKENTALHLGAANLILKYGVLLIPVVVYFMLRTIRKVFMKEYHDMILVASLIISLINIPEFFLLSNFWLTTPIYLWFWFCLVASKFRHEER